MPPDRHDTLLLSFTTHLYLIGHDIDVGVAQARQLRQTHAARVEHFQHREVARFPEPASGSALVRLRKQHLHLVTVELGRYRSTELESSSVARRIHLELARR